MYFIIISKDAAAAKLCGKSPVKTEKICKLSRTAGVSEAGASWQNPQASRSESKDLLLLRVWCEAAATGLAAFPALVRY